MHRKHVFIPRRVSELRVKVLWASGGLHPPPFLRPTVSSIQVTRSPFCFTYLSWPATKRVPAIGEGLSGGPFGASVGSWFRGPAGGWCWCALWFPSALEGVFVMRSGSARASSSTIARPISQLRKRRHKDPCSLSHNQHLAELDFETTCVLSQPK